MFTVNSSILAMLQWAQNTASSTGIRESVWLFPIIESIHVLALALSFGTILWLDLRMVGIGFRRQPVAEVFRQVLPISFVGFSIMIVTGSLLFWSSPVELYLSIFFRLKMMLLVLAGLNALVFQMTAQRSIEDWGKAAVPPTRIRLVGGLSLFLWMAVIAFGRATAYNVFH